MLMMGNTYPIGALSASVNAASAQSGNNVGVLVTGPTVTFNPNRGAWFQMFPAIGSDVHHIQFQLSGVGNSAQSRYGLLDIGIDQAGGTAYTPLISSMQFSAVGQNGQPYGGPWYNFPIRIPIGSSIAARITDTIANMPLYIYMRTFGLFANSHVVPTGSFCETIGTPFDGVSGVQITTGATGSKGAWTSMGTTTNDLFHWTLSTGFLTSNMAVGFAYFDVAVKTGTDYTIILPDVLLVSTNSENSYGYQPYCQYFPLPAGSAMYARGAWGGASSTTSTFVMLHGVG